MKTIELLFTMKKTMVQYRKIWNFTMENAILQNHKIWYY